MQSRRCPGASRRRRRVFELTLTDAWVWDIYRSSRFVRSVRVITYKDVNVEELSKPELDIP